MTEKPPLSARGGASSPPDPPSAVPSCRPLSRWSRSRLAGGLTLLALLALYLAGVAVRTQSFYARGHRHDDRFWVESAQHFRNVRMVAEGGTIPLRDVDLEYPDGLETRSHTIHGEWAIGLLARTLPLEAIAHYCRTHGLFGGFFDRLLDPFWPVQTPTLSAFVRYLVRLSTCTLIFWLFLNTREITGSRTAGLIAAALFAFSFGAVSRSLGDTFYHEHVALPLLGVHLWLFHRALRRPEVKSAVLSALFLVAALLTWKVIEFYFLVLMLYFLLMFLGPGLDRRSLRLLAFITGFVLLSSVLLNVHLRYNRFFLSRGMLVAYGILIASLLQKRRGPAWKWSAVAVVIALMGLKAAWLPNAGRYTHVWQTFFYRLRYLSKPLDPTLLPFDVRHYWVPPYVSPNLFAFLNEVFWPVVLAAPAIAAFGGFLLLPRGWRKGEWTPERRGLAFLFVGFFAFLAFYLLFYKIKTFLLLFSIPWVGYVWNRLKNRALGRMISAAVILCLLATVLVIAPHLSQAGGRAAWNIGWGAGFLVAAGLLLGFRRKLPARVGLLALVGFAAFSQGYQTVAWSRSWLAEAMFKIHLQPSKEKDWSRVVPGRVIPEVIEWAAQRTEPGEAFLCEFVLSPSILEYARRPINQHCFFESNMRMKYEEFSYALFKSEEEFYQFCQKYQTTYFVYNAHMLLRDDPNMSFRYISASMDWNPDWAAYRFHFRPETLEHFELAFQNDFVRVYRVLEPGKRPSENRNRNTPYSPLFDEVVFQRIAEQESQTPAQAAPEFLYATVNGYEQYYMALAQLGGPPEMAPAGLARLIFAARACPWAAPISNRLGRAYEALGQAESARQAYQNTLAWRSDDLLAKNALRRLGEENSPSP